MAFVLGPLEPRWITFLVDALANRPPIGILLLLGGGAFLLNRLNKFPLALTFLAVRPVGLAARAEEWRRVVHSVTSLRSQAAGSTGLAPDRAYPFPSRSPDRVVGWRRARETALRTPRGRLGKAKRGGPDGSPGSEGEGSPAGQRGPAPGASRLPETAALRSVGSPTAGLQFQRRVTNALGTRVVAGRSLPSRADLPALAAVAVANRCGPLPRPRGAAAPAVLDPPRRRQRGAPGPGPRYAGTAAHRSDGGARPPFRGAAARSSVTPSGASTAARRVGQCLACSAQSRSSLGIDATIPRRSPRRMFERSRARDGITRRRRVRRSSRRRSRARR